VNTVIFAISVTKHLVKMAETALGRPTRMLVIARQAGLVGTAMLIQKAWNAPEIRWNVL